MAPNERSPADQPSPSRAMPDGIVQRLDTALIRLDAVRDRPALSIAVVVVVASVLSVTWWLARPPSGAPVEASIPFAPGADAAAARVPKPGVAGEPDGAASPGTSEVDQDLFVHVAGAVIEPGIVELEPGSRVVDAVTAAGGPTSDADLDQLNLAAPLVDGVQVRVPVEGEVLATPVIGLGGDEAGDGPVDVNAASVGTLETLPGIGPSLANAIVDWRTEHGPFVSVDALLDVPGIGPAKLAALADLVVV